MNTTPKAPLRVSVGELLCGHAKHGRMTQTVKKPQFEKELSLRGAQPRGNPFPKTLRFWTHYDQNGNILGMRIATSGYALLAMTAFFDTLCQGRPQKGRP
mgnify:CR=1 FL=1